MGNMIPVDPFRELARFDPLREFEGAFGFPRLRRWMADMPAEPTIRLDITEDEKAYHVKAELPGVKKEDIEVQVEGNQVSLSAEVKREKEEKRGEAVVHSERYYGRQFRSFTLGQDIDRAKTEAKFEDGVLNVTLPKAGPTAPAERIAVK